METSQKSAGFLSFAPLKSRFCSFSARRLRADVVPKTNRSASMTLLFPEPFGPQITLKPDGNGIVTRFAKDLKPCIVIRSRRTIIFHPSHAFRIFCNFPLVSIICHRTYLRTFLFLLILHPKVF